MGHNILGQRFFNKSRELAWHKLGVHSEEELSAMEALRMLGEPVVTLQPINAIMPDGTQMALEDRVIMRHPLDEDPEFVPFGIVGPDYQMINAGQLAMIADEFVAQPVETMGFLRRGSVFFCTFALPEIDVKGDPVEMYLGAVAPMNGKSAASVEKWCRRVVCDNTFKAAQTSALEKFTVIHDQTALRRMGEWMGDMYREAVANVALVQEAFTLLADARDQKGASTKIIEAAYPFPKAPRQNAPEDVLRVREERQVRVRGYVEGRRAAASALFQGQGTGMDLASCRGTLYGAVQAVVELENNRRGRTDLTVAESNLIGPRAVIKSRALNAALELVK